jgi:hypothetical protein
MSASILSAGQGLSMGTCLLLSSTSRQEVNISTPSYAENILIFCCVVCVCVSLKKQALKAVKQFSCLMLC